MNTSECLMCIWICLWWDWNFSMCVLYYHLHTICECVCVVCQVMSKKSKYKTNDAKTNEGKKVCKRVNEHWIKTKTTTLMRCVRENCWRCLCIYSLSNALCFYSCHAYTSISLTLLLIHIHYVLCMCHCVIISPFLDILRVRNEPNLNQNKCK